MHLGKTLALQLLQPVGSLHWLSLTLQHSRQGREVGTAPRHRRMWKRPRQREREGVRTKERDRDGGGGGGEGWGGG